MQERPTAVVADRKGRIVDWPGLLAAGRRARTVHPLDASELIPLPKGSRLYLLPKRRAVGFHTAGATVCPEQGFSAVAAFLPPGYTALTLAAFEKEKGAPPLPLFCYCAVCWHHGKFHVPAVRVDSDPKHDPSRFDENDVKKQVSRLMKKHPRNRLIAHHGLVCALKYGCPNAANLFLHRWEAPVAVSGGCNAACRACISEQTPGSVPPPQKRIGFVPTVSEIVELAVPHLEEAPRAMISFGQGCEGEPLLRGKLIADAIREIRKKTDRGTIHLNTNGSKPDVVKSLIDAGLNSIRVSLNSAREPLYSAYYRCHGYSFDDVMDTFRIAKEGELWISLNYLTFPGVTDDQDEFAALSDLLSTAKPDMIQWRNLNIDPDAYMGIVSKVYPAQRLTFVGLSNMMRRIRNRFPHLRHGYFNPPVTASDR
jgi:pyruvate-formate lyase-activating enzyme